MNRLITAACAVAALTASSACSLTESNEPSDSKGSGTINVDSSADACQMTATKAPSGNVVFKVKNTGSEVTEFYLYAEDGLRIVGEIENVGPGLSRDLVVRAAPGKYVAACKPGMTGQGIRSDFTVTDSGKSTEIKGVDQATIDAATTQYAAYVKDQSQQLVDATAKFNEAFTSGDDDAARDQFPHAREYWERIETVAESFGDLDPKMDIREADLEPGQEWTGWHRIEKELWPPASGYEPMTKAERQKYADDLLANTKILDQRVQDLEYTVDQIGNGSKGCSTRSPAARSPARRTSGRTPTSTTSRPTSTAPGWPSRASSRSSRSRIPSSRADRGRLRRVAGEARRVPAG